MSNSQNPAIIKVGYSNDPSRRVNELNKSLYGNNFGCRNWQVHTKFKSRSGLDARELERKAHNLLADYRVNSKVHPDRELFACTADKAKQILIGRSTSSRSKSNPTNSSNNDNFATNKKINMH